mgnify:CR=1 FL=1
MQLPFVSVGLLAAVLLYGNPAVVEAACTVDAPSAGTTGPLKKHLGADCTAAEREANAIPAAAVLRALAQGRTVDLSGAVIQGDLVFDQLPVQKTQMPKGLSAEQEEALKTLNTEEMRIVSGALLLKDSVVQGAIRHRSAKGTLQFEAGVDLQGTTFKDGVDLSRAVFLGPVSIERARFEREAYFIQGHFGQGLRCVDARFGPHTRFHRSVFRGPLECQGSVFDGLAEFLEVVCEQPVNFERARFGSGTGFSGAQFKKTVNFSEAIFSRESFFAFTLFGGETHFAGAQFLQSADFSNAEFKRGEDLAKVRFDQKPSLNGTKGLMKEPGVGEGQSQAQQYLLTLFFLVAAALLVAYAIKK